MGSHITTFTQDIADQICDRLSAGEPLAVICRSEGMPAVRTVSDWKKAHESFAADFAQARDDGFDFIAAECIRIADDMAKDTILTEYGPKMNAEWVARCRLQIETRLKLLAKWDWKRYGDRLKADLTHGLDDTLLEIFENVRDGRA